MRSLWASICIAPLLLAESTPPHIKSAVVAYQAGEAAVHDKQWRDAITQFQKAIQIEPTFRDAFDALIAACLDGRRRSEAAAAITQLLEIEPDLTRYRLLLGQILLEENQRERALAQFSSVLKSDPLNADALLGFAAAARRLGMNDRALEALERGRKQYPLDKRFNAANH